MMQETGNGGWEVSWASSLLEERACFYLVEFVNTEEEQPWGTLGARAQVCSQVTIENTNVPKWQCCGGTTSANLQKTSCLFGLFRLPTKLTSQPKFENLSHRCS